MTTFRKVSSGRFECDVFWTGPKRLTWIIVVIHDHSSGVATVPQRYYNSQQLCRATLVPLTTAEVQDLAASDRTLDFLIFVSFLFCSNT